MRSLLIDNEPTHFVVSSPFHSNLSHANQYEPTHFVVVLIFTLTAAITTSHTQCVEKPTRPPRFCANTNIRASFHPGFSIICQLPYPDDHQTPWTSLSFAVSFERKFHTRMPNPTQHTSSRTCTSIFTQDMRFNRVEQTMHLACYSEQHNTRTLNSVSYTHLTLPTKA